MICKLWCNVTLGRWALSLKQLNVVTEIERTSYGLKEWLPVSAANPTVWHHRLKPRFLVCCHAGSTKAFRQPTYVTIGGAHGLLDQATQLLTQSAQAKLQRRCGKCI